MGQIHILTQEQGIILDLIAKDRYLSQDFYFTGGTALSEYYLRHRFSEDLDLFSQRKIDQEVISSIVNSWSTHLNFKYTARFVEVVYRFEFIFPKGRDLKVDFGYFPYQLMEKGLQSKSLSIDSLRDIATNKMTTINQRTEVKDFVDLYYILQDKYTIWDLLYSAQVKFPNMIFDPFLLAQDLLKAEDFTILPRMVKHLTLGELKKFFREKAKELGRKAVE